MDDIDIIMADPPEPPPPGTTISIPSVWLPGERARGPVACGTMQVTWPPKKLWKDGPSPTRVERMGKLLKELLEVHTCEDCPHNMQERIKEALAPDPPNVCKHCGRVGMAGTVSRDWDEEGYTEEFTCYICERRCHAAQEHCDAGDPGEEGEATGCRGHRGSES